MPVGSLAEPHAAASSTSTSTLSDLVEICMVFSSGGSGLGYTHSGMKLFHPDGKFIPSRQPVSTICRFQATVHRDRAEDLSSALGRGISRRTRADIRQDIHKLCTDFVNNSGPAAPRHHPRSAKRSFIWKPDRATISALAHQ